MNIRKAHKLIDWIKEIFENRGDRTQENNVIKCRIS